MAPGKWQPAPLRWINAYSIRPSQHLYHRVIVSNSIRTLTNANKKYFIKIWKIVFSPNPKCISEAIEKNLSDYGVCVCVCVCVCCGHCCYCCSQVQWPQRGKETFADTSLFFTLPCSRSSGWLSSAEPLIIHDYPPVNKGKWEVCGCKHIPRSPSLLMK